MLLCQTLSLSILKSVIAGRNSFVGSIDPKKGKIYVKKSRNQISQIT